MSCYIEIIGVMDVAILISSGEIDDEDVILMGGEERARGEVSLPLKHARLEIYSDSSKVSSSKNIISTSLRGKMQCVSRSSGNREICGSSKISTILVQILYGQSSFDIKQCDDQH